METTAPVVAEERISSVDVLRGVALLGILLMNIQDFGLPGLAYDNPTAWGGATGWNLYYWVANQIFFEGKMRFLFSLLFGAGIVLITDRAANRGAGIAAADIYFRRNLWLILLGLLHGYMIWGGDILYSYGVTALGLFVFRVLSPKQLLIAAGVVFFLLNLSTVGYIYSELKRQPEGLAALKVPEAKRTKEQKKAVEVYQESLDSNDPVKRRVKIEEQVANMRKGYWEAIGVRAPHVFSTQTALMMKFLLWDVAFPMLLGMALYKADVLSASRPIGFYVRLALAGYAFGIPILAWSTRYVMQANWDVWARPWMMASYEYGRLTIGLGHLGLVLLIFKLGWLRPLTTALACVGQMALSNYLLTSILMTLYFNGYGLGMFAVLERHQLLFVVFSMWSINLIWSPVWLRYFRFGPVEWAWRSLTYWKKQPFRIGPPADPSTPIGEPSPGLPSEA